MPVPLPRRHGLETGRYEFRPVVHTETPDYVGWLAVEVKIKPCDVGDIARQMALYREHTPSRCGFVVATCWRMSPTDRATLRDKGIHTIHLGAPFEEYCRARANEAGDPEEVEL